MAWFQTEPTHTHCITRHTLREYHAAQLRPQLEQLDVAGNHILLVEDNAVNQQVALLLLKKLGCEVTVAEDGAKAVAAITQQHFDIVLMDCQMPVMDGFEATRAIRALEAAPGWKRARVPIIAITANALKGDDIRCFDAGMDDYLPKPLKPDEIKKKLAQWRPAKRKPRKKQS
jgi:CheY-like chemotaxis protein